MNPTRALIRNLLRSSHPRTHPSPSYRTAAPPFTHRRCIASSHTSPAPNSQPADPQDYHPPQPDLHTLFAKPTWSVRSLLPAQSTPEANNNSPITPETLHHLLRLSALPPPPTPDEEAAMLRTLRTQLHFVRDVQSVATAGVAPLRAIRDETSAGAAEATVTADSLREALARESVMGYRRRPRRDRAGDRVRGEEEKMVEEATRERRERRYYLVDTGKTKGGE